MEKTRLHHIGPSSDNFSLMQQLADGLTGSFEASKQFIAIKLSQGLISEQALRQEKSITNAKIEKLRMEREQSQTKSSMHQKLLSKYRKDIDVCDDQFFDCKMKQVQLNRSIQTLDQLHTDESLEEAQRVKVQLERVTNRIQILEKDSSNLRTQMDAAMLQLNNFYQHNRELSEAQTYLSQYYMNISSILRRI